MALFIVNDAPRKALGRGPHILVESECIEPEMPKQPDENHVGDQARIGNTMVSSRRIKEVTAATTPTKIPPARESSFVD